MLTVETFIAPSKIHRLGLFAANKIEKCVLVCYYVMCLDNKIFNDYYEATIQNVKTSLEHYAFRFDKTAYFTLFYDNARFINHSTRANLCYTPRLNCLDAKNKPIEHSHAFIALRDIPSGEELTLDYSIACPIQYDALNAFTEHRDAQLWPPKVKFPT